MNACTARQAAAWTYLPLQHCLVALARCSTLCRLAGQLVAVRLAFSDQDQCAAQLEVAVYERIQELQGCHVPRLLAYGYTCGGSAYLWQPHTSRYKTSQYESRILQAV